MATPEANQLGREVVSKPGGAGTGADWELYTPLDCIRKMDHLMSLIIRCDGNMSNYEDDWEQTELYRPFVITRRVADAAFFQFFMDFVHHPWYIPSERISSSHLRYFYSVVLKDGGKLPYIATPEGSDSPVSWFRSTGDGFWCTMRPSSQALPLYVQDVSARAVLYRTGVATSPVDFTGPISSDLQNLLKLVRQMRSSDSDASKALVSLAIDKHMRRITNKRARNTSSPLGGISVYQDDDAVE